MILSTVLHFSAFKINGVFVIIYVFFVGYALKMLTELLASFLEQDSIKQQYKGRLVGAVLNGYLSLRRLVVQRTRLIDDTQEKLLELLEEMTTGTEVYIISFFAVVRAVGSSKMHKAAESGCGP
jgi:hypothetical protein